MKKFVLFTAGGMGIRMQTSTPKQFIEIAGKPALIHAMEAFVRYDSGLSFVLVLPENYIKEWNDYCRGYQLVPPHLVVSGGSTRFHSVQNGLKHVPEDNLVAIHDGVRPLVSLQTIQRVFECAEKFGNAIPCVKIKESLRCFSQAISKPLDRESVRIVQTPQAFHSNIIKRAYEKEYSDEFTDDATLLESNGFVIHSVEGNYENLKITTPEDLVLAEALLRFTK